MDKARTRLGSEYIELKGKRGYQIVESLMSDIICNYNRNRRRAGQEKAGSTIGRPRIRKHKDPWKVPQAPEDSEWVGMNSQMGFLIVNLMSFHPIASPFEHISRLD